MRVIAGKFKGRKLVYPKTRSIRPTMDRVKESMFNLLGREAVEGKKVLSLFSGTGSLGIEALSRGAEQVVFMDHQALAIETIQRNLKNLPLEGQSVECYQRDAFAMVKKLYQNSCLFDLVFVDPPYYQGLIRKALIELERFDILTRFSLLVFEHSKAEPVVETSCFSILKSRRFGDTCVTVCQKNIQIASVPHIPIA